jgi:phage shock protein PspC (stress-responsive transcriptional regulator)
MYCTRCGTELTNGACYCSQCGLATGVGPSVAPERLMRLPAEGKVAGVCAGLGRYMAMDVTVVRILWLLLTFGLPPAGILGYIAAWILMPKPLVMIAAPMAAPPQQPASPQTAG